MPLPETTTREQRLTACSELLEREKALTRAQDSLNADRRRLPMIRLDEDYRFEGPDGTVTLLELFGDHEQLVVQHVMFDPDWDAGCPGCTAAIDEIGLGFLEHLASRGTAYVLISRAPFAKLERHREEKGWFVPWYSSYGSDFNYDFHVSLDASVLPVTWNYRSAEELAAIGAGELAERPSEQPGISCFLRRGEEVFHTYSAFARGCEQLLLSYRVLDLTALGRHEDWEEPKGRVAAPHGADPTFTS